MTRKEMSLRFIIIAFFLILQNLIINLFFFQFNYIVQEVTRLSQCFRLQYFIDGFACCRNIFFFNYFQKLKFLLFIQTTASQELTLRYFSQQAPQNDFYLYFKAIMFLSICFYFGKIDTNQSATQDCSSCVNNSFIKPLLDKIFLDNCYYYLCEALFQRKSIYFQPGSIIILLAWSTMK